MACGISWILPFYWLFVIHACCLCNQMTANMSELHDNANQIVTHVCISCCVERSIVIHAVHIFIFI
jgi:hypothetical protein